MSKRLVLILLCGLLVAVTPSLTSINAQESTNIGRFSDDFTDNRNGWALGTRWGDQAIGGGILRLTTDDPGLPVWTLPDSSINFPARINVTVSVHFVEGYNGQAAILLNAADHRADPTRRTTFYGIALSDQGEWKIFRRGADANSSAILQRGEIRGFTRRQVHAFAAVLNRNVLYVMLDGVVIGSYTDTENPLTDEDARGGVGLYVSASERNLPTTVEFSELRITTYGDDTEIGGEGNVLFADDFRMDTGQWWLRSFRGNSISIEDSALVLQLSGGNNYWSFPYVPLPRDYTVLAKVEVDASVSQGNWYYGIGVRYSVLEDEQEPYYAFLLTSDRYWGFFRVNSTSDDVWQQIQDWTVLQDFDAYQPHLIKVSVEGDIYRLYVDGEQVAKVEYTMEEDPDEFYMALIAGAFSTNDSMVRVRFTDVEIRAP
ncbi:MAG: hypothetical protein KF726_19710 [Anaerolineae bacterium]|nr:hypothetical protein [Anaerolineae bacterium]